MRPPSSVQRTSPRAWGLRLREAPHPQATCAGRMLPSLHQRRSAPRNSTRFAAQYPAHRLPVNASRWPSRAARASLGAGAAGWALPRGRLAPPILCQLVLAHSVVGQECECGERADRDGSTPRKGHSVCAAQTQIRRGHECTGDTNVGSRPTSSRPWRQEAGKWSC